MKRVDKLFVILQSTSLPNAEPNFEYKKIIVNDERNFKVVYIDKDTDRRVVKAYIISADLRIDMQYENTAPSPDFRLFPYREEYNSNMNSISFSPYAKAMNEVGQAIFIESQTASPVITHAEGETATDEPTTETVTVPFTEEPIWLFQDIMFRKLYPITRNFLEGLNAERVALLTKVDQLAGGVGDDEDHRRYDHAANLGRGLIGYTWEQINILSDDTIPAAKKKTRTEITSLIEKLEATFPDHVAIDKFFVRHDEVHWQNVRQNRQIRLVGDNYQPGEEIRNINAEHIKTKNGVTAVDQVSAENEYARCVKQCFRAAWADRRDVPRHTIQYSFGSGDTVATVPKSQLTDESTLGHERY